MKLYGREWARRDLEARLGRIEQLGGLRRLQGIEGPEAGSEEIQVRTGAGLSYAVLPSRGMDIGLAEFGGTPLCWLSPNGPAHPAFFDGRGTGWLKTAAGGLLMTCGLTQVGSPGEDGGESLGLHGRAHHIPARQVAAETSWEGDEYLIRIRGQIEETAIFGPCLRLNRCLTSRLGENEIAIHDEVENTGFESAPHMLLYHFNLGFPLISEATRFHFPSGRVVPREPDLPLQDLDAWLPPQPGYREGVYYHENLAVGPDGMAALDIINPRFPLIGGQDERPVSVRLSWNAKSLPVLVQWKMPGMGTYVLGVEPANCHVAGRAAERERGTLVTLSPGQSISYDLKIAVRME